MSLGQGSIVFLTNTLRVPAARKMSMVVAAVCLSALLSSCALLKSPPPPRDTFELTAPASTVSSGGTRAQLLVKVPTALKSIDSDRIIVREGTSGITYLAGAQWADTVPRMVQARLVEAFENTGATGATAKPGDGLVIDYQLVGDIRKFEIDASGAAVLEISVKLLSDRTGKVVETRIFKATSASRGDEAGDYVSAIDAAYAQMATNIVNWVLRRV